MIKLRRVIFSSGSCRIAGPLEILHLAGKIEWTGKREALYYVDDHLDLYRSFQNGGSLPSQWQYCKLVVAELSSVRSSRCENVVAGMREVQELVGDRKILWVCHFRPDVIWNVSHPYREALHEAVKSTQYHFDPSPYIQKDLSLLVDEHHYSEQGYEIMSEIFFEKLKSIR